MAGANKTAGLLVTTVLAVALISASCDSGQTDSATQEQEGSEKVETITRTDEEWKSLLPAFNYHVLREKGTEPAFSGEYDDHWEDGVYLCFACELPLFDSSAKFHSGTGWPSFTAPIDAAHVEEHTDSSHGMVRVEVTCARCGGHLGHVFEDGPAPTGLRYCMNSVALKFQPR